MNPSFTIEDIAYRRVTHRVNLGQLRLCYLLCFIAPANFQYLLFRESGLWMPLPSRLSEPFLLRCVLRVVFGSPKEKMLRINARAIVAGMAHKKTVWNFTVRKFIRDAMRLLPFPVNGDTSVSSGGTRSDPSPTLALAVFYNLGPEPFFNIFRKFKFFGVRLSGYFTGLMTSHWHGWNHVKLLRMDQA